MLKKIGFLFLVSCLFIFAKGQDSCSLRISLLTCAPGQELYSTFGHTAIRVQDRTAGTDYIFNYGTFEFGEGAGFYIKFVRGKLPYFLSVENFGEFMSEYKEESRSVLEQELLYSCTEKQHLYAALKENAQPQNSQYKYDFLFDNCTTRAKNIIARNSAQQVVYPNVLDKNKPTFRNLLHSYLDASHEYWSKLGIDLLLGARLDRKMTNEQAMFLPDYLLKGFDSAQAGGKRLMAPAQTILQMPSPLPKASIFTPFLVFLLLLVGVAVLSFVPTSGVRRFINVFDRILFFSLGLIGVLLLFMWFGTDHAVCRDNYNLLWAFPTHLIAAFFLRRDRRWMHYYLLFTIILLSLLLIGWIFLPQQLNIGWLPLVLLVLLRAWLIVLKPHHVSTEDRI